MTKKEFVEAERKYMIELLKKLTPSQWHADSLCEGWTVEDVAAHIVVREGLIGPIGIVVPQLHKVHDKRIKRLEEKGHAVIIQKLERYPWYMPAIANTAEFYIHNEDILRGSLNMHRSDPNKKAGEILWQALKGMVKIRKSLISDLGNVQFENSQSGAVVTVVNKHSQKDTVVSGMPGELLLFAYGRRSAAKVKITSSKL